MEILLTLLLQLVATIFNSSRIYDILDEDKSLIECRAYLTRMVIFEVPPGMAYVAVAHVLQEGSELVPFGIPFIACIPPSELVSVDGLTLTVLDMLNKALILKDGSNVSSFRANLDDETDPSARFELRENSVSSMDLIWDSAESKGRFYNDEQDNKVIL